MKPRLPKASTTTQNEVILLKDFVPAASNLSRQSSAKLKQANKILKKLRNTAK